MTDLTIFVGTFNRTDTLKRAILNLRGQDYPHRVVIVDNGSKDSEAVRLLDELAQGHSFYGKHPVYRLPSIEDVPWNEGDDERHGGQFMQAVQTNYSTAFREEWEHGARGWFAVCDCDTAPEHPESLSTYVRLAEGLGCAVGPHLNLDVHRNYPLRSCWLILNARTLFRNYMKWWNGIPYSYDPIDTTFHLFPASPKFDRLQMQTARVGPPWWTPHTDSLIDITRPSAENLAYVLGGGEASHWGGSWMKDMFAAYQRSPEEAFALTEATVRYQDDYFHAGFILSWMLQYGHGCEVDLERSWLVLKDAFPNWSPCWQYVNDWHALVYENDQSCLGWG